MALTHELADKTSPVRRFIEDRFPIISGSKRGELFAAPLQQIIGVSDLLRSPIVRPIAGANPGLVGTAIDFRLRYYFKPYVAAETVAAQGARRLGGVREGKNASKVADALFKRCDAFVNDHNVVGRRLGLDEEDLLARHCLLLAYFEQFYRMDPAYLPSSPLLRLKARISVDELLTMAPAGCIEDVRQISWAFEEDRRSLFRLECFLNPKFDGSAAIGGADADMIIDNCISEIKTVANPTPGHQRDAVSQLLGYTLLDYSDRFKIRDVAIIWTRQRRIWRAPLWLFIYPIADIVRTGIKAFEPDPKDVEARLEHIRQDFRQLLDVGLENE